MIILCNQQALAERILFKFVNPYYKQRGNSSIRGIYQIDWTYINCKLKVILIFASNVLSKSVHKKSTLLWAWHTFDRHCWINLSYSVSLLCIKRARTSLTWSFTEHTTFVLFIEMWPVGLYVVQLRINRSWNYT